MQLPYRLLALSSIWVASTPLMALAAPNPAPQVPGSQPGSQAVGDSRSGVVEAPSASVSQSQSGFDPRTQNAPAATMARPYLPPRKIVDSPTFKTTDGFSPDGLSFRVQLRSGYLYMLRAVPKRQKPGAGSSSIYNQPQAVVTLRSEQKPFRASHTTDAISLSNRTGWWLLIKATNGYFSEENLAKSHTIELPSGVTDFAWASTYAVTRWELWELDPNMRQPFEWALQTSFDAF
ncbi:MAG: hypothetical protein M1825_003940 [Sarcosagium campestre]|nr:MAG: hypothetical protein M1825_003940 [Sarcosagium campestre]